MIQYELFLKEISDFLRSCTIKNKYFAQITADRVMDKYGLDTLPDHFNPYYLRMCGLSTLDLPIPLYLYDEEGNQIINEDRKYRCITDTDVSLTQLLLVRMDETDSNGSEIHPVKDKVQLTVNQINRDLAIAYLKYIGFYSPEETKIDDRILIWRLDTAEDKNSALQSYMAGITFTPNDDKRTVVNIITGEYDWENLARQSPVYSDGIFVNSAQEIASIEGMVAGQYAHSLSEKKTYKFNGTVWQRIAVDTMLEETIKHYKNENEQITSTTNISFITSYEAPTIEALVVIGDLNWDDMYQNNTGYTTLCEYPTATDIAFEDLTTHLGYSESETPPVGMRVNFNRNARCWVNDDDTSDIIYTKQEIPQVGDNVYVNHFLNTSDFVINETNNPILVDEIETVAAGSFIPCHHKLTGYPQLKSSKRLPVQEYCVSADRIRQQRCRDILPL